MDWRRRAACRDEDPELFFAPSNAGPSLLQIAEAKAVCARCPVTSACLAWALETGQDAGVWGGLSEDERRQLRRKQLLSQPRPAETVEPVKPIKPSPRELLLRDGLVIAAPDADSMGNVWGNVSKRHAVATDGKALCKPSIVLDLRRGVPASGVVAKLRCRHQLCRSAFETADQRGCETVESLPSNT